MWRIFSSARLVFAWLGHDTDEPERIEESDSDEYESDDGSGYATSQKELKPFKQAANEMKAFKMPYFSRCWIVPEILQARYLTFLISRFDYPVEEFAIRAGEIVERYKVIHDANFMRVRDLLRKRFQIETTGGFSRTVTEYSMFLDALKLLHGTECSNIRDRIFAALSDPSLTVNTEAMSFRPDYRLTRDELVVVVINHLDKLEGRWKHPGETARTLASSLILCDGVTLTDVCELNVIKAILSSTIPWLDGDALLLKSGREIGRPGQLMRYFLTKPTRLHVVPFRLDFPKRVE